MILKLIAIWFGSKIVASIINIERDLRKLKDLADCGYRTNFPALIKRSKSETKFISNVLIFNVAKAIYNLVEYFYKTRPMLLSNLEQLDLNNLSELDKLNGYYLLIPMSEEEKERYFRKPTSLNAFLINFKPYSRGFNPFVEGCFDGFYDEDYSAYKDIPDDIEGRIKPDFYAKKSKKIVKEPLSTPSMSMQK